MPHARHSSLPRATLLSAVALAALLAASGAAAQAEPVTGLIKIGRAS